MSDLLRAIGSDSNHQCYSKLGERRTISGYDDDPRELWEIADVRKWFRKANSKIDDWFFFINSKMLGSGIKLFFACLCDAKWNIQPTKNEQTGFAELEKNAVKSVFDLNWPRLNRMTDHLGMSEQENKKISYEILDAIGMPHED